MADPLQILLVEDSELDAELILRALRAADFEPTWRRVQTESEYVDAVHPDLDVIFADYHVPSFGAPQALRIHRERTHDVPFVVVSGTIGEERAVAMIKEGADDYILKDRLGRVGPMVRHLMAARKLARERKAAEIRYQELFERVPVGIYRTSEDGTIVAANPEFARVLGYPTAASLVGIKAGDLFAIPEELPEWMSRILRDGVLKGHPMRLWRYDGTDVWIANSVRIVPGDDGATSHFEGAIEDISALKRNEASLEERARLAQFTADVAVALTEIPSLEPMLNRCAEIMVEQLGAAFARFWTLNEAENVLELKASAGMYTHVDGPHARVPVGQFKIGLIAAERKPHLTNSVVGDPRVSDQSWAKSEKMIGFAGHPLLLEDRLLGVMAMFSRAPLSPMVLDALASVGRTIAVAIHDRTTTAALRKALERAEAADKLLSRFARGDFVARPEAVDVVPLADNAVRRLCMLAEQKGLALTIEHESPALVAWIDVYCIRRALDCVLDNAVKFTGGGGAIVIRTFRDDVERPCLSVRDSGIGIGESYLLRVFQPFSQEEGGATRRFEGPGIGLALTQRYLENSAAQLMLESEKDVGTVVTFRLPVVAA